MGCGPVAAGAARRPTVGARLPPSRLHPAYAPSAFGRCLTSVKYRNREVLGSVGSVSVVLGSVD
eukprot:10139370-Alexandrium_andersonii.AAC.1